MNLENMNIDTYHESYHVTYLDENGKGFSDTKPWIQNVESKQDAEETKRWLLEQGFQQVKIHRLITISEVTG